MNLFAFDFDGTITNVPGQHSAIFSNGKQFSKLSYDKIYTEMKNIFEEYIPEKTAIKFRTFFREINNYTESSITIQTNNYKNVVISCLVCYLQVPIDHIDFDKSCFRECDHYKHTNINELAESDEITRIYYFEDSKNEIKRIKNRDKVKIIYCKNGMESLSELLKIFPVIDQESLNTFLNELAK